MVGAGYSPISPTSVTSQIFVSLETIAGTIWTVVVFAGVVAYLGRTFDKLANSDSASDSQRVAQPDNLNKIYNEIAELRRVLERNERERQVYDA
jgi:hypothetical protein